MVRLAIASEENKVSGHFGFCEDFKVFDIEDGKIINETTLENPGHKPGFLPNYLADHKVNIVISGGMGEKAISLFNENHIEVILGASGNIDSVIESYIEGKLESTGTVCREHKHSDNCEEH